ncbi:MAG: hypothetical protein NTY09_05535 [bacterium]|nr:hypothetical protein [bacterium]
MEQDNNNNAEFKPTPPWIPKLDDHTEPVTEGQTVYDPGGGYGGLGESLVAPLPPPMKMVFADMAGVVFLVWLPIMAAFLLPWSVWVDSTPIIRGLNKVHIIVALIISLPPWIVLMMHLKRGRLADGILDMFLWAIWESIIMISMCYLYPRESEKLIWHASLYWDTMRTWIATGSGPEGNPILYIPIHVQHLLAVSVGAILLGLPALMLGVFQLNYMNYYVAQCMLLSGNPLLVLPIAWHFWSVLRVMGFITIASSLFQWVLKGFRAPANAKSILSGIVVGLILVIADLILKGVFAEQTRFLLKSLTGL